MGLTPGWAAAVAQQLCIRCSHPVCHQSGDGMIHRIVSNIAILKAYRIVLNIAIVPAQTIRYFALLY